MKGQVDAVFVQTVYFFPSNLWVLKTNLCIPFQSLLYAIGPWVYFKQFKSDRKTALYMAVYLNIFENILCFYLKIIM